MSKEAVRTALTAALVSRNVAVAEGGLPEHQAANINDPVGAGQPADAEPSLLEMANKARELRLKMSAIFPNDIFVDRAWDMMIDLTIAHAKLEKLCVKDLVILSGERPTSAMRRIDRLQEAGLIVRHSDPRDHRRMLITLTQRGIDAMTAMLHHLHGQQPDDVRPATSPKSFRPLGPG